MVLPIALQGFDDPRGIAEAFLAIVVGSRILGFISGQGIIGEIRLIDRVFDPKIRIGEELVHRPLMIGIGSLVDEQARGRDLGSIMGFCPFGLKIIDDIQRNGGIPSCQGGFCRGQNRLGDEIIIVIVGA